MAVNYNIPLQTQLEYMMQELQGPESATLDAFGSGTAISPQDYAEMFEQKYERSGGEGMGKRRQYALEIFRSIDEGTFENLPDNVQTAFNFFKGQGFTDAQAAGIVGNLQVESFPMINPQAYNPEGGGLGAYGIAQFRGPRLKGLLQYAGKQGENTMDGNAPFGMPLRATMKQDMPQQRGGMMGGIRGLLDYGAQINPQTGLSRFETFAAALDPLIMPSMRGGETIRARGAQRVQQERRNKTIAFLENYSPEAAELMRGGLISPAEALNIAKDMNSRALAKQAAEALKSGDMQTAMAILTELSPTAMGQQIAAQSMKPPSEIIGGGRYTVTYPEGRAGKPVITVNEDVIEAEERIAAAQREREREAAGLPSDARKAEEADFEAITTIDNLMEDISGIIGDFGYNPETGEFTGPLDIGPSGFLKGVFGSFGVGGQGAIETAKARDEFERFKTRLVNTSLRLNKGVQTEGDAQRAAKELGDARTEATAYAAIQELLKINQRARANRVAAIQRRRDRFRLDPVEVPTSKAPDLKWRVK